MSAFPASPRVIAPALAMWLLALALVGCGPATVSPVVPAGDFLKEYQEKMAARRPDAAIRETIRAMSQVTENHVFTEKEGLPEYLIGPGDGLELTFWEQTVPKPFETTVRQDGRISYSFLDDVPVAGLTARAADQLLSEKLSKYIRSVRLDVNVKRHESRSALLFGEVNILQTGKSGPGKYNLKGKTSVLDLLVEAGGMTKNSDLKNVELVRGGKRYSLNLYDAMFRGVIDQNVIIDDGDIVTIPELPALGERVYVFGEVENVGIYPHKEASDLLAAIAMAGGYKGTAVKEEVKIIRGFEEGKPRVIAVNLREILEGGDLSRNLPLETNDLVYVPRTAMGDLNEWIANTTPLLEFFLYPGQYRDAYSDPRRLRWFLKD